MINRVIIAPEGARPCRSHIFAAKELLLIVSGMPYFAAIDEAAPSPLDRDQRTGRFLPVGGRRRKPGHMVSAREEGRAGKNVLCCGHTCLTAGTVQRVMVARRPEGERADVTRVCRAPCRACDLGACRPSVTGSTTSCAAREMDYAREKIVRASDNHREPHQHQALRLFERIGRGRHVTNCGADALRLRSRT
jgi:hypothetical protein